MFTRSILIFLFALGLVSGQSINSAKGYNGVTYAFDGHQFLDGSDTFVPHAYEITNGAVTNTYVLNGNTGTHTSSAFINGNTLYQFHGAYGEAYLTSYALPLASSPVDVVSSVTFASHLMIPGIVDFTDNIALAIVTRNLNVVDLNTFTITSTYQAIVGSKKSAGSLVYNHDTNRAYFFINHYCSWGDCQHIQEYEVTNGVLAKLDESFAPNYDFGYQTGESTGCEIDYTNGNIWCLNAGNSSLQYFPVADLNTGSFFNLPAGSYVNDNVEFDFVAQKAYVVSVTDTGYGVFEVSLADGSVVRQASFDGIPVISVSLDVAQGKLFLGHDNVDSTPELSTIDLTTFTASHLVL